MEKNKSSCRNFNGIVPRLGITGGIGSGKSVVCRVFQTLGIPVFNADNAAKWLMENDPVLVGKIKKLLGDDVYDNYRLNKAKVSSIVFTDKNKLQELNQIVHPATRLYAKKWFESQTAPYTIKEAALFFESGTDKDVNIMLGVFAPEELRISRTMNRSSLSREQVLAIISKQMDEQEKMKLCQFVITNDDHMAIIPQVLHIHNEIMAIIKN